jgi:PEP-CTERM motif
MQLVGRMAPDDIRRLTVNRFVKPALEVLAYTSVCLVIAGGASAAPIVVYTNDFETGVGLAGAGSIQGTQSFPSVGNFFFRNDTDGNPAGLTTLTLSGLPSHDNIDINFLLGFVGSWDSRNGSPSPDNFDILVNGVVIASLTAANSSGSINDFAGGTQLALGDFGFGSGSFFNNDRLVDLSTAGVLNFTHTASSITLGLRASGVGWQAFTDESWAVDNFRITVDTLGAGAVPEPASWALMIAGFGLVGGAMRRRVMVSLV